MAKWHCDVSEWYPVLTLSKEGEGLDEAIEFSDEEIEEFRKLLVEFRRWQGKLKERFGHEDSRPHDLMGGEVENLK